MVIRQLVLEAKDGTILIIIIEMQYSIKILYYCGTYVLAVNIILKLGNNQVKIWYCLESTVCGKILEG